MDDDDINKLTHKIIGCAKEVHNNIGNGFQELVYQRALAIEFSIQDLSFARELEMPLEYNYCEAYNIADGLLINFGGERLQYHRVFNNNKRLKNKS